MGPGEIAAIAVTSGLFLFAWFYFYSQLLSSHTNTSIPSDDSVRMEKLGDSEYYNRGGKSRKHSRKHKKKTIRRNK